MLGKTAEEIAKALKLDLKTVKELMKEGTWAMASKPNEISALKKLMQRPIPVGDPEKEIYTKEMDALYGLLGDDELFDMIGVLGDKKGAKADARPVIMKWFAKRIKDDSYGLGDETKKLGKAIGLKMDYVPEGLDEKKTVPSILMPMSVKKDIEKATKKNLIELGLPFDNDLDVLLMKEENGWTSDKTSRRELIAKDYRILLMVGDQLTDFISSEEAYVHHVERKKIASKYSDMWGKKWFVITNPMYGRWEYSIYDNESPESEEAATAIRINSLRP